MPVAPLDRRKVINRVPADSDELWYFVRALWGVKIPRYSCCPEHTAPFDAFAEAYFARTSVAVWKASRGFGGKSFLLAVLSATEAVALGARVSLLGGSGAQSANVHEHMQSLWHSANAPSTMLTTDNKMYMQMSNGAAIKALTASQKSVRGPHPQRLRLDEIDEMEVGILEAAQGQPMRDREKGIETNTVLSSTHQYPDKCCGAGTLVWTERGEVPIEHVVVGDRVMTRKGWRSVVSSALSGFKPVVQMRLSNGRLLTTTLDHRIALYDGGWSIPELFLFDPSTTLAGLQSSPLTIADPAQASTPTDVGIAEIMPTEAMGLPSVDGGDALATQDVGALGDILQVGDVATVSVQAPPAANVVDLPFRLANEADVGPTVGTSVVVGVLDPPVALGVSTLPAPASSGWINPPAPAQEPVFVVGSHTVRVPQPVYDLEVEGEHEFVAEGVVVHNTMKYALDRAELEGWPVHEWCWRCTSNPHDGWLEQDEVDRKRREVTKAMWDAEYDLQEPSFEGRAIDSDLVDLAFDKSLGIFIGNPDEVCRIYDPPVSPTRNNGMVTAIDWGKERHWCVAATYDTMQTPWVCVAWKRFARQAWPVLVRKGESQAKAWGGRLIHDATGIGNVIADYMSVPQRDRVDQTLNGKTRTDMFNDYIAAIEHEDIRYPMIEYAYDEHRYVTEEDLFTTAGHPPDSFIVGALAWSLRRKQTKMVPPRGASKTPGWSV